MNPKIKLILFLPFSLLICLLIKHFLPVPLINNSEIDYFWTFKTHGKSLYNILVIGDSRVYRGIAPSYLIDSDSPLTAYNLGYSSAGFSKEYLEFAETRLTNDKKHTAIIVGISPYSLTPKAAKNEHYHGIKNQHSSLTLRILYKDKLLQLVNPYDPHELKQYFWEAASNNVIRYTYNPDGWVKSEIPYPDPTSALVSYRKDFINNKVSEEVINELMFKVNDWKKKDLQIIGFRIPTTDRMVALEDSLSGFNYNLVKNKFIENGGDWLEFSNNDFTSYDGSHLDNQSAIKLSTLLKDKIKKKFAKGEVMIKH